MWCCWFFFKHRTAYERRISDWSSDVCSSDRWCAILDGNFGYGDAFCANLAVLVARMAEPSYQKVLGDRPLLYMIGGVTAGRVVAIRDKAAEDRKSVV